MGIEEIPVDMGAEKGFWFFVIINGKKILVIRGETKLAYFYGNLRKEPKVTVQKQAVVKGVPAFLALAKTHHVLKTVENWDNVFGKLH